MKVYVIVGYRDNGHTDVLGYTTSKKKCNKFVNMFKDEYVPKYIQRCELDMIGWRFNNDFEEYYKVFGKDAHKKATKAELRKDWEKYGGGWQEPIYHSIDFEEVEELTDKLPPCRYSRGIIEKKK